MVQASGAKGTTSGIRPSRARWLTNPSVPSRSTEVRHYFFLGTFLPFLRALERPWRWPACGFSACPLFRPCRSLLSSLVTVHLALHLGPGAARIYPFPLLGHKGLLDKR